MRSPHSCSKKNARWWPGLSVIGLIVVLALALHAAAERSAARAGADEPAAKKPDRPKDERGADKEPADEVQKGHVKIEEPVQVQIGLETVTMQAIRKQPATKAYGALELDPARGFTIRAPLAGVLHPSGEGHWPTIGQRIEPATVVAVLEPRLTASEQFDLAIRKIDAQAEVQEVEAELGAARSSFEGKRKLNAEGKAISERIYEEAEAKVNVLEARLENARRKVATLDTGLAAGPRGGLPLMAPDGGEVVELAAAPGEAVESGQIIARLARFDRLLARLELPPGSALATPPPTARLVAPGRAGWSAEATLRGIAPTIDARTQGQAFWYEVPAGDALLRPGLAVIGYLSKTAVAQEGVVVPRSALLRYAGNTWVYVQTDDEDFERRAVELTAPVAEGWFIGRGLHAGEDVVTVGAQLLLSEELKAQIEKEAAAAGE